MPAVRGAEAGLALQAAPAGLRAATVGRSGVRLGCGAGQEDGRDGGDFLGLGAALLDADVRVSIGVDRVPPEEVSAAVPLEDPQGYCGGLPRLREGRVPRVWICSMARERMSTSRVSAGSMTSSTRPLGCV